MGLIDKKEVTKFMTKTVLGIFAEQEDAEDAISRLKDSGYDPKDISIVMRDNRMSEDISDNTGTNVVGGALSGATTGALLGSLAGLLASFAIPGLGAFFIGGPIATALGLTGAAATTASGAATGALAGGLIGALTGFGLSEEEARIYEERLREGGILVAVPARVDEEAGVEEIFADSNADDIKTVTAEDDRDVYDERPMDYRAVDEREEEYISYRQPVHATAKGGKARSKKTSSGKKGGRSSMPKNGKGRGWHDDPKGHSKAAQGEEVRRRND
jgi:hypothetical protein